MTTLAFVLVLLIFTGISKHKDHDYIAQVGPVEIYGVRVEGERYLVTDKGGIILVK